MDRSLQIHSDKPEVACGMDGEDVKRTILTQTIGDSELFVCEINCCTAFWDVHNR